MQKLVSIINFYAHQMYFYHIKTENKTLCIQSGYNVYILIKTYWLNLNLIESSERIKHKDSLHRNNTNKEKNYSTKYFQQRKNEGKEITFHCCLLAFLILFLCVDAFYKEQNFI